MYAHTVSRIPCRHFVLCKVAGKTNIIHADILVLVSEFVVSEWWSMSTTVGASVVSTHKIWPKI